MVAGLAATLAITSCGGSKSGVTSHDLSYDFIKGTPSKTLVAGDIVEIDLIFKIGDSVLNDSRKMNQDKPIELPLPEFDTAAPFNTGLPLEGFYMMNADDSAIFKVPSKIFFESVGQPMPEWIKDTDTFKWEVAMRKVTTAASFAEANAKLRVKSDDFATTKNGVQYKIIELGKGGYAAQTGDIVEMNIEYAIGDTVIFNTMVQNNGLPIAQTISPSKNPVDIMEAVAILQEGDSAVIRIPMKEFMEATKMPLEPWMKETDMHEWRVKVVSVKSAKQMKEDAEKAKKDLAGNEDKVIQEYIKANNIQNVQKTENGLYYTITSEGTGPKPTKGQSATVNYTGKLIDGKVFDSNVDPKFGHAEPFTVPVGAGQVIAGWDQGLMLLNQGSKATFIIPSALGYGERAMGQDIPANSILVFDVELTEVK